MIKTFKRTALLFALLFISAACFAQETQAPVEMADGMRQSGKIYVVAAVLLVIMIGIFGYLIMLDRKISKLEKELKSK